MLRCGKHAGVRLHLSATTKNQITRLMQQENGKNRTEFVQSLIVEELARESSETGEEEESARAAISAYMDSPQSRETFRRFVAEILLDEEPADDRRRGE